MNYPLHSLQAILAAIAVVLSFSVPAEPILTGKNLSEKNLIEALEPAAVPAGSSLDDDDVKVRSIRVIRDQPSSKGTEHVAKAPPPKTSASVLITFVTNSSELAERAKASLDIVARAMQDARLASFKFAIEGHADPRGNADDNLHLSQARADSVVNYLAERHQISRERLKPIGKGDTEPFDTRHIDAPENRRVTIVTLHE